MSDFDLPGVPPHWRDFCSEIGAQPFEIINNVADGFKAAHVRCLWPKEKNGALRDSVLIVRVYDDGSFVTFAQVDTVNIRVAATLI